MNTADYSKLKIAIPDPPCWLGLNADHEVENTIFICLKDNTELKGKLLNFSYMGKFLILQNQESSLENKISFEAIAYLYFLNKSPIDSKNIPDVFKRPGIELPQHSEIYKVLLENGSILEGKMASQITDECGIHIFKVEDNSICRYFIPRQSVKTQSFGNKIGNELLSKNISNAKQLSEALRNQHESRNIRIGEVLLEFDLVNEEDLEKILRIQDAKKYQKNIKIGDLLVQENLLSKEKLDHAIHAQHQKKSMKLGHILVDMGIVSSFEISRIQANKLGVPLILLEKFKLSKSALNIIPYSDAKSLSVLPLEVFNDSLLVACSDPLNSDVIISLQDLTDKKIEIAIAPEEDIDHALYLYYGSEVIEEKFNLLEDFHADSIHTINNKIQSFDNYLNLINALPSIEAINSILLDAIEKRAELIHFKPGKDKVDIFYRFADRVENVFNFHKALLGLIVDRLKVMAELELTDHGHPQAGHASVQYKNQISTFIVSMLPTNFGESLTIQFKGADGTVQSLANLGFETNDATIFTQKLNNQQGLVLVVGPKTSGKTTSYYSAANLVSDNKQHVISLENPTEQQIGGIEQINLCNFPDIPVFSFMHHVLLQEPDAIFLDTGFEDSVGNLLFQKALTDCLLLITMETNTFADAYTDLTSLPGVNRKKINQLLSLVIVQRLARKNCEHCLEYEEVDPAVVQALGATEQDVFYQSSGCLHCEETGFSGKLLIYALIDPDDNINALLEENADINILASRALMAARKKVISFAEAYRVSQSLNTYL